MAAHEHARVALGEDDTRVGQLDVGGRIVALDELVLLARDDRTGGPKLVSNVARADRVRDGLHLVYLRREARRVGPRVALQVINASLLAALCEKLVNVLLPGHANGPRWWLCESRRRQGENRSARHRRAPKRARVRAAGWRFAGRCLPPKSTAWKCGAEFRPPPASKDLNTSCLYLLSGDPNANNPKGQDGQILKAKGYEEKFIYSIKDIKNREFFRLVEIKKS